MTRLLLATAILLLSHAAVAQTVITGLPAWPAVLIAPSPDFKTGLEGQQDQFAQWSSSTWNGANQLFNAVFAVPSITGTWNSGIRLGSWTGHQTNQYTTGWELGVEGTRVGGLETINRFYLYRHDNNPGTPTQQTILFNDLAAPQTLIVGEAVTGKRMQMFATGSVAAPVYWGVIVNADGSQTWKQGYSHPTKTCAGTGTRWVGGICVTQ